MKEITEELAKKAEKAGVAQSKRTFTSVPTQNLIATDIIARDYNMRCQIYSGQGKTVIMIIIAMHQIKFLKVQRVNIITCDNFLLIQLKKDVQDLLPSDWNDKIHCYDSSAPGQTIGKYDLMLIDEYDKTFENLVNVFKNG